MKCNIKKVSISFFHFLHSFASSMEICRHAYITNYPTEAWNHVTICLNNRIVENWNWNHIINMNFLPNVQLKTYQNIYGQYWNNPQQLAKILIGIPIGDHSAVHVLLSWFYPDFIYILSRFYPDFIQILSKFYPHFLIKIKWFF